MSCNLVNAGAATSQNPMSPEYAVLICTVLNLSTRTYLYQNPLSGYKSCIPPSPVYLWFGLQCRCPHSYYHHVPLGHGTDDYCLIQEVKNNQCKFTEGAYALILTECPNGNGHSSTCMYFAFFKNSFFIFK